MTERSSDPIKILVLISGGGTNLQAIINAIADDHFEAEICAVISNKADAYGLVRAEEAKIPTHIIDHTQFDTRRSFDLAVAQVIDRYKPQLIVLAGFMRILTPEFVNRYPGKMLNIHPSLLPKYPGLNTHEKAFTMGDSFHGASIHFVTAELDGGPIIAQGLIKRESDDSLDSLTHKVTSMEHRLYPEVISWFAAGRIGYKAGIIKLDGEPLPAEGVQIRYYQEPKSL